MVQAEWFETDIFAGQSYGFHAKAPLIQQLVRVQYFCILGSISSAQARMPPARFDTFW